MFDPKQNWQPCSDRWHDRWETHLLHEISPHILLQALAKRREEVEQPAPDLDLIRGPSRYRGSFRKACSEWNCYDFVRFFENCLLPFWFLFLPEGTSTLLQPTPVQWWVSKADGWSGDGGGWGHNSKRALPTLTPRAHPPPLPSGLR